MDHELRNVFRACLHSQLVHSKNLERLEFWLDDCLGPSDADRLYQRLQELIHSLCIEIASPEVVSPSELPDEDIDAIVLNAAEQMEIPLPGARLPRSDRFT